MTSLHDRSLIIDALNFHGDGDPTVLRDAGIAAINLTVSHFEADFEKAMDGHGILARGHSIAVPGLRLAQGPFGVRY